MYARRLASKLCSSADCNVPVKFRDKSFGLGWEDINVISQCCPDRGKGFMLIALCSSIFSSNVY